MPLARLRALGHELSVFMSEEILTVDLTAKNSLWTWIYGSIVRPLSGLVRIILGDRRPRTVAPTAGRPTVEFRDKCTVTIERDAPPAMIDLAKKVSQNVWYHTFDLGHGLVTPGAFDHAPIVHHYQLPSQLTGLRVLDVACFDGFWAMEFEKRGAAEVVALDINSARELDLPPVVREKMTDEELDRPMGYGFELIHEAKGSQVKRVHCNVYDLSPDLAGMFDIVHIGDVLFHLQNPMKALANVRTVTRGFALISDVFDPRLDRLGNFPTIEFRGGLRDCVWWYFGLNSLEKMIRDAGFRKVELVTKFKYGMRGDRQQMWHAVFKATV